MYKLDINNLAEHFKNKNIFETADIFDFYHYTHNKTKPTTVNWRIHSLVQRGVLQRVGRGKYSLGKSKNYVPEILPKQKTLYKKICKSFKFTDICVWHTSIFNEFMLHQAGKFYYLVEAEKDATEAIFYFLKEKKLSVFLNPNQEILEKYIPENKDVYIVKSLVSEAPVQKTDDVITVTLEKALVDVFCDETLFATQQGAEMRKIFDEALSKYTVNQTKMLRYANRRKKKTDFEDYLNTISNYRQQYQFRANI